MTKEEERDFPTCCLGGGQNEVWLSLNWDLVNVDIVSASWQEVADGDRGGCARNIWRSDKKLVIPVYLFSLFFYSMIFHMFIS